jgi:para-nitrobenzyl esterase
MPAQPSEFYASGHLNALDVMLGGNSFDGLASYTVPYIVGPKTHMISPTMYEYEMQSSWGGNAAAVEKLYSPQDRFDGNTNAAFMQPDGDAAVVCPTMEMARQLTTAGGRAFVFHFAYKGCSDSVKWRVPSDYASHASEIPYVWGASSVRCYSTPGEERLTLAMQEFWGSFTRTGRPVSMTVPSAVWPAWSAADEPSMLLNLNLTAVKNLKVQDCTALHKINSSFWPAAV